MMGADDIPGMTMMARLVPVERYPLFVAREAGILIALSAVLAALAVLIVRRRRPT